MSIKAVRIDLPADLHEYLTVVLKRYSGAGIDPEEGMALFHLWEFVTKRAKLVELVEVPPTAASPASADDADGLGDR